MIRRFLLRGALALGVATIAIGVYLQTRDGFTRVLVPVVDALLPADLNVREGHLDLLTGTLEAAGLTYRDRRRGVAVRLERGRVRVSLASLVARRPLVHDLALRGVAVETGLARAGPRRTDATLIPITARRVRVDDLTLRSYDGDRVRVVLGPLALTADHLLEPGGDGRLALESAVQLDPTDPDTGYAGHLTFAIDVAQDDAGRPVRWDGAGEISLSGLAEEDVPPLVIATTLAGTAQWPAAVTATAVVDARVGGDVLGGVTLDVATRDEASFTGGPAGARIAATVALRSIPHDVLNPFFAPLGRGELAGGELGGRLALELTPDLEFLAFDGQVDARELRLALDHETTPRVDVSVAERGSWSVASGVLHLEELALRVQRDGKETLASRLLRPLSVDLQATDDTATAVLPAEGGEEPIGLHTRVTDAELDDVRTWLRFLGIEVRRTIRTARVDADVAVGVNDAGTHATLRGETTLSDLRLQLGPGEPAGDPLDVHATFEADVRPSAGAYIHDSAVEVSGRRGAVGGLKLAGRLGWDPPMADVDIGVTIADVSGVLAHTGALPAAMQARLHGGTASGEYQLTRAAGARALRVAGRLRIAGLGLPGAVGVRRDLVIEQSVGLTAAGLAVDRVQLASLDESGHELGTISVRGWLPSGGGGAAQRLHLTLAMQEAAPWLALAGLPVAPAAGPVEVGGQVELHREAAGGVVVTGDETIRLRRAGGAAGSTAVRFRHDVSGNASGDLDFSVEVHAGRNGDTRDHASVRGRYLAASSGRPRPLLDVSAAVDALDLTDLVPLIGGGSPPPQTAAAKPRAAQGSARGSGDAAARRRLPVDVRADVSLQKLRYRKLEVQSGRARVSLTPTGWRFDVEPLQLGHGTISGLWDNRMSPDLENIEFRLEGQQLDVNRLFQSLETGEVQVDGLVDFVASGSARVPPDKEILPYLEGTLTGDMDEGRLRGLNLMAFLADRTGLKELRRVPLDSFDVTVGARIGEGALHFDDVYVFGNLAKFQIMGQARPRSMDLTVQTFVFPSVARALQEIGIAPGVFSTLDRLTALPMATRVWGPYGQLQYAAVRARAFGSGARGKDRRREQGATAPGRAGRDGEGSGRGAPTPPAQKAPQKRWTDGLRRLFGGGSD